MKHAIIEQQRKDRPHAVLNPIGDRIQNVWKKNNIKSIPGYYSEFSIANELYWLYKVNVSYNGGAKYKFWYNEKINNFAENE